MRIKIDENFDFALIDDINLKLSQPFEIRECYIPPSLPSMQLKAAWMSLDYDTPMNPRIIGKPGVGKTSLALHVSKELELFAYILQCTSDLSPDDLLITPVLNEKKEIRYHASPLLTAMLLGGTCILDEGNRMSEKTWASIAPLLDHRRYVDTAIISKRIFAHKNFRFATTMNEDTSVYELPEYIQSRLCPQIILDNLTPQDQVNIVRETYPAVKKDIIEILFSFLTILQSSDELCSIRDSLQIVRFAQRLASDTKDLEISHCFKMGVKAVLGEDFEKILNISLSKDNLEHDHLRPV